jgi:hypothetical protein
MTAFIESSTSRLSSIHELEIQAKGSGNSSIFVR